MRIKIITVMITIQEAEGGEAHLVGNLMTVTLDMSNQMNERKLR